MSYFGGYFGPLGTGDPGTVIDAPDTGGPVLLHFVSGRENRAGANWPPLVFQVVHETGGAVMPLLMPDVNQVLATVRRRGGDILDGMLEHIAPQSALNRFPEVYGQGESVYQWVPDGGWPPVQGGEWDQYEVQLQANYADGRVLRAPSAQTQPALVTISPALND